MGEVSHWENVYRSKPVDQVGWYCAHLQTSLEWISALKLSNDDPLIDVGGGASTLIDDLLDSGHNRLTLVDLSEKAIAITRQRLSHSADRVDWRPGDITQLSLPRHYFGLWHDRAVYHFLTDAKQQERYKTVLVNAVRPSGYFLIGTFGPNAPPQCSGLPVQRYSVEMLRERFGDEFELVRDREEIHVTPSGLEQAYVYCLFRKTG